MARAHKKDEAVRWTLNVTEDDLADMAELFKLFGDSTRIKILYALWQGERNVTDICAAPTVLSSLTMR